MRLIDADTICEGMVEGWQTVLIKAQVDNAPTVDAVAVTRCKDCKHLNGEAINKANEIANLKADGDVLRNKLNATEAALEWANAELTHSVDEKNALRNDVTKMTDRAAFELGRANYAEAHPWRNLWAWVKRKLGGERNEHVS